MVFLFRICRSKALHVNQIPDVSQKGLVAIMNKNETQADVEAALKFFNEKIMYLVEELMKMPHINQKFSEDDLKCIQTIRAALQRKAVDFEELEGLKKFCVDGGTGSGMSDCEFNEGVRTVIKHLKGKGA